MKKRNKNVLICIIIFLIIVAIVLIIDFNNALYFISKNFNYDFLGIFIPNIILLLISVATYFLVDGRNLEKEETLNKNQLNVLNIMLQQSYVTVKKGIEIIINDDYMMKQFIVPRASSKKAYKNDIVQNIQTFPFVYDEQIMKMMYDGLADKEIINKYIEIKRLYKSYVDAKVNCYDLLQYDVKELDNFKKSIEEDKGNLIRLLEEELERIK